MVNINCIFVIPGFSYEHHFIISTEFSFQTPSSIINYFNFMFFIQGSTSPVQLKINPSRRLALRIFVVHEHFVFLILTRKGVVELLKSSIVKHFFLLNKGESL